MLLRSKTLELRLMRKQQASSKAFTEQINHTYAKGNPSYN